MDITWPIYCGNYWSTGIPLSFRLYNWMSLMVPWSSRNNIWHQVNLLSILQQTRPIRHQNWAVGFTMPSMEGKDPSFHFWPKLALHLDIMNHISSMDYECCYSLDRLLQSGRKCFPTAGKIVLLKCLKVLILLIKHFKSWAARRFSNFCAKTQSDQKFKLFFCAKTILYYVWIFKLAEPSGIMIILFYIPSLVD